ncbi:phage gene 29 protein family protein [Prescottella equi]|uniref:phage gene 29 protein family protein n=1 Tax=Rhodococcus hoagii TaxID=43767 RepID=UPI00197E6A6C|nr:DUF2744 domain-containing protein [Prescottella equi]MBM4711097.1 DUF2744 domain-containing protein [Prescottella equi]NKR30647.1 DUF2744 domain-containing protein [Prescottella equi]NKU16089.1 DUF2744 domain-containing protein [Prescottella equi]NKU16096.1 DUF2744 domain-containing protein [Prescottella equi]NKU63916.1 DUF2744 domain-containing protein [Prescottella equi]
MIPIQSKCDMNDPEQHCLWALVGIKSTGVPLLVDERALRELSAQLVAAGFRHHPELQERKVATPPGAEGVHWLALGAVEWVDIDEPEPELAPAGAGHGADLDAMSAEQLIALGADLKARGVIRDSPPPEATDVATVGRAR